MTLWAQTEGELADLRAVGDQLQSAASRLAEYVSSLDYDEVPYEVSMAVSEARRAVADWTALRRKATPQERPQPGRCWAQRLGSGRVCNLPRGHEGDHDLDNPPTV